MKEEYQLIVYCQDGKQEPCNERHVKICRKPRKCDICFKEISKGEQYYATLGSMGFGRGRVFNMQVGGICLADALVKGYVGKTETQKGSVAK